ncbi:MAG: pyrroline-5-carboxylate reductase [Chloroflexi bacterium]|nr:pyrroline-5-carboxylate reductase [Chloroflexota bacterium]MCL5108327.1 pyrroline-5-carboxylate reductase [Chloroflexota bacterium]MDA8218255.1 pyrroline-5-carboxylate reductase [Dehalococcoidales bacterium]
MLERVTVVGSGTMGEAFVKGLLGREILDAGQIVATDALPERRAAMKETYGVLVTEDNGEAVAGADVVVLAVKPQVVRRVLDSINGRMERHQLVITIVAGIPIATVVERMHHLAVVRAMPNTPGQIGQGATVWTATTQVTPLQREQTGAILRALGVEVYVDDERYLDAATALSGSGPAYVYLFYEALVDAGVHIGFSRHQAEELVYHTIVGSLAFLKQSGKHPAELRNGVTSPGGTTTEALLEMEDSRLRAGIIKGVAAAYRRSIALGKGAF